MNFFNISRSFAFSKSRTSVRPLIITMTLLLGCFAQTVQAQWQVTDKQVTTNTGNTASNTSNTATNTDQIQKDLKEYLTLGSNSSPGERVKNPAQYPLVQSTTLQQDLAECKTLPKEQLAGCEEIAKTEDAQSQYMKTMYENTNTRDKRLREILKERDKIDGTSNLGKLEDNTNKLVALYDLMTIDSQQMESVNYAYETRLRYLRANQTKLAKAAATGKKPGSTSIFGVDLGQIATAVTTGGALKIALDVVKKEKPEGMRTLSIGKSTGYGI